MQLPRNTFKSEVLGEYKYNSEKPSHLISVVFFILPAKSMDFEQFLVIKCL